MSCKKLIPAVKQTSLWSNVLMWNQHDLISPGPTPNSIHFNLDPTDLISFFIFLPFSFSSLCLPSPSHPRPPTPHALQGQVFVKSTGKKNPFGKYKSGLTGGNVNIEIIGDRKRGVDGSETKEKEREGKKKKTRRRREDGGEKVSDRKTQTGRTVSSETLPELVNNNNNKNIGSNRHLSVPKKLKFHIWRQQVNIKQLEIYT